MEKKPFSRKITDFKTKRLAADYVLGRLDSKSHSLVTQKLQQEPEFKTKVEGLEGSVHFCQEMAKVRIIDSSIEQTLNEISHTNKISAGQRLRSVKNNLSIGVVSLVLAGCLFQIFLKFYLGKSW